MLAIDSVVARFFQPKRWALHLPCSPFDSMRSDRLLCRFNLILFVRRVAMLLPIFNSKIKTRLKLDVFFRIRCANVIGMLFFYSDFRISLLLWDLWWISLKNFRFQWEKTRKKQAFWAPQKRLCFEIDKFALIFDFFVPIVLLSSALHYVSKKNSSFKKLNTT